MANRKIVLEFVAKNVEKVQGQVDKWIKSQREAIDATEDLRKEVRRTAEEIDEAAEDIVASWENVRKAAEELDKPFKKVDKTIRGVQSINRVFRKLSESFTGTDSRVTEFVKNLQDITNDFGDLNRSVRIFTDGIADFLNPNGIRRDFRNLNKNVEDFFTTSTALARSIRENFRFDLAIKSFDDFVEKTVKGVRDLVETTRDLSKGLREELGLIFTQLDIEAGKGLVATRKLLEKSFFAPVLNGFLKIKAGAKAAFASGGIGGLALFALSPLIAIAAAVAAIAVAVKGIKAAFATVDVAPVADAFENLSQGLGTSKGLLNDLTTAASGTISQFQLLKTTNLALAGATGTFREELGTALPKLLEIARVQASATGESVDFLFDSLVRGIKRGSPLLIDNTGLVISLGEANREYARELGKTVEELTAQEKQVALTRATLEGGAIAIAAAGGLVFTSSQKLEAIKVIFKDIGDEFGLAFQPMLRILIDIAFAFGTTLQQALRPIFNLFEYLGEAVEVLFESISYGLEPLFNLISSFISFADITQILKGLLETLSIAFRVLGDILNIFLNPLNIIANQVSNVNLIFNAISQTLYDVASAFSFIVSSIFSGFIAALGEVIKSINIFSINTVISIEDVTLSLQNLALGATNFMASFAASVVNGGIVVIQAVTQIAKGIADLLIGQSPPPKGPLSVIDEGGENIMLAWLEGISGVSLSPVEDVVSDVNSILGDVGNLGLDAIESRLFDLDEAIRPFTEQVQILEANLNKIQPSVDAALDAIDTQQQSLIKEFNDGNLAVLESVRLLDAQREAIAGVTTEREKALADARIQLALAEAQQAEERALLSIQQARLGPQKELVDLAEKTAKGASSSATKSGSGDALVEEVSVPPQIAERSERQLSEFAQSLVGSFNETFSQQADVGALVEATGALSSEAGRVSKGLSQASERFTKPFSEISSKISNIFSGFDLGALLTQGLDGLADTLNGVENLFSSLSSKISQLEFIAPFDLRTVNFEEIMINPASSAWEAFVKSTLNAIQLVRLGTEPLIDNFIEMFAVIETIFTEFDLGAAVTILTIPFMEKFLEAIDVVREAFRGFVEGFDPNNTEGWMFALLSFLTSETVTDTIRSLVDVFESTINAITAIMADFGRTLPDVLVSPIIYVFNSVIRVVNDSLAALTAGVNATLAVARRFGARVEDIDPYQIPQITRENYISDVPGLAKGGTFGPGLMKVGERGPELIASSTVGTVFPANLTRSMEQLVSLVGGPPIAANANNTITNTNSRNYNFSPTINTSSRAEVSLRQLNNVNFLRG